MTNPTKYLGIDETDHLLIHDPVLISQGAADAGKIPALGPNGKLDESMLPVIEAEIDVDSTFVEVILFEDAAGGSFINIFEEDDVVYGRLASALENKAADGFIKSTYVTGQTAKVYVGGKNEYLVGLIPSKYYFLSDVPGQVVSELPPFDSQPRLIQKLGKAVSETTMTFDPMRYVIREEAASPAPITRKPLVLKENGEISELPLGDKIDGALDDQLGFFDLTDPDNIKIVYWDDDGNAIDWLGIGPGISYDPVLKRIVADVNPDTIPPIYVQPTDPALDGPVPDNAIWFDPANPPELDAWTLRGLGPEAFMTTAGSGSPNGFCPLDATAKIPLVYILTGTTPGTIAAGNHTHSEYAVTTHTHSEYDKYDHWNININGTLDEINSSNTVSFVGSGGTTITYNEGTKTVTIESPASDKEQLRTSRYVAGETIATPFVVYVDTTTGKIMVAKTTNVTHAEKVLGISLNGGGINSTIDVLTSGTYYSEGWTFVPGKKIWCSASGVVTQDIPTSGFALELGYAPTATTLVVNIKEPIYF